MGNSNFLQNYSSLMEIAGIKDKNGMTELIDVLGQYRTNTRNTTGFIQTPLKPAFDMTYSALKMKNRVGIMAKHIAFDSHARPISSKGFEVMEGNIPHIAANRTMGREDYLQVMKVLNDVKIVTEEKKAKAAVALSAKDQLFSLFDGMISEHDNRVSFMRGQSVSTGTYSVTQKNNDGSFTIPTIDFGVPTENKVEKTGVNRWWDVTTNAEILTSDPIKDLSEMIHKAVAKNLRKESLVFEVDYSTLMRTVYHSNVRKQIGFSLMPAISGTDAEKTAQWVSLTLSMGDDRLVAALEGLLGVKFIINNDIVGIEILNPKTGLLEDKEMKCFEENVFVLRRKGDIGQIFSTSHIKVGEGDGKMAYYTEYNGGSILMTYTADLVSRTQRWDTEETTLLVPTDTNYMFYLTVTK